MTRHESLEPGLRDPKLDRILKLAVMAVGGQGGGVLTGWIETLGRTNGFDVQATSVAGVAQRTGATIYYIEMAPKGGATPVFSLAPAAGDVDIVIAAEMMEAGRAILRGFVTPDRTALIASTHRALAVSEKTEPGNGIQNSDEVRAAAEIAARQLVMLDLERIAVDNGSVISASLFGALAGAGVLPFPRDAFEAAIAGSGRGVEASMRAFAAAFDQVGAAPAPEAAPAPAPEAAAAPTGPADQLAGWQALLARVDALPDQVHAMARAGLRKVVDFQSVDYGALYLDRLNRVLATDRADMGWMLSVEAAKYIANAMAYDDVIRVADLKTRPGRFRRIRAEMGVGENHVMHLTEFMHPRAEEIAGLMPERLGRWCEARPSRMALIDRLFNRGRRLRSDGIVAFGLLYLIGGLRTHRLRTLRHAIETAHLERWLTRALTEAPRDYALAVELIRARRLIKGYSDTHARGLSKFDRVVAMADDLAGRADASDWLRRLHAAALKDEEGKALDGALATLRQEVLTLSA